MFKNLFFGVLFSVAMHLQLESHCQMPCGIYHDEMIFDTIDQYVETMAKAITVLQENAFKSVQDKNTFCRWVMEKDQLSDDMAVLFTTYFLQQKIKPGDADTPKKLALVHNLLFYLVKIKQTVDLKVLNDFNNEWEKFKLTFHIEGYKCKVYQDRLNAWKEERQKLIDSGEFVEDGNDDDHPHDHEHGHTH